MAAGKPTRVVVVKPSLREYLAANMFDGDGEHGTTTMPIKTLLDDVCHNVVLWMIELTDTADFVGDYFEGG